MRIYGCSHLFRGDGLSPFAQRTPLKASGSQRFFDGRFVAHSICVASNYGMSQDLVARNAHLLGVLSEICGARPESRRTNHAQPKSMNIEGRSNLFRGDGLSLFALRAGSVRALGGFGTWPTNMRCPQTTYPEPLTDKTNQAERTSMKIYGCSNLFRGDGLSPFAQRTPCCRAAKQKDRAGPKCQR